MTIDSELGLKRPYATPKLVAYGDMSSLTKAGSGSFVEAVPGMGMVTKRP